MNSSAGRRQSFSRGGLGLRVENTLASFGNALQLGVSTLELDVQITADGAAVVTHDRRINPAKCAGEFGGRYIKDLTLAQVRTMDCGSQAQSGFPGQLTVPGAKMPLLSEIFSLVRAYRAEDVKPNIETKVEAGAPGETAPREQFVQVVASEIRKARIGRQVTIQSFDWGALMRVRQVEPSLPLVALTNFDFLRPDNREPRPGSAVSTSTTSAATRSRPSKPLAPRHFRQVHGFPQNGRVTDRPGLPALCHRGDGQARARQRYQGDPLDRRRRGDHEQAHRRRRRRAHHRLSGPAAQVCPRQPGDLHAGADNRRDQGRPPGRHPRRTVNGSHCQGQHVGRLVHDLTLAQIKTLDCGSLTLPEFPNQVAVPGVRIPTLDEVFDLMRRSGRTEVRMSIETKISPLVDDTERYDIFTKRLVKAIQDAGMTKRATIQSFDWRTIMPARKLDRRIETVALVWQYGPAECASLADECSLQAVYGDPSVKSPWTGDLDWWRYRDLEKLVKKAGATTVSANWQVHDPGQGTISSPDWYLKENPAYFHGPEVSGLKLEVIPYTVNFAPVMDRLIDLGVDGIISDDPDLLVKVAIRHGLR